MMRLGRDNYHSLAVLNYTHTNKIDTIFIDPPYNTGNDTFRFNDDIVEKDDPYRHRSPKNVIAEITTLSEWNTVVYNGSKQNIINSKY